MTRRHKIKRMPNFVGDTVSWRTRDGNHPFQGTVVAQELWLQVEGKNGDKWRVEASRVTVEPLAGTNGEGI